MTTFSELVNAIEQDNSEEPTIDAYHDWVDNKASPNADVFYAALKLNGEAGEVADIVGKALRNGQKELDANDRDKLLLELGDVLWYITHMANLLDLTLDQIMEANVNKLEKRIREGTLYAKERKNEG